MLARSTAAMAFSGCPRTGPSVTQNTHFHVLPSGSWRLPSALSSTGSSRPHTKFSPRKNIGSSSSTLQPKQLLLSTCLQQRERDRVLKERARIGISGAIAHTSDKVILGNFSVKYLLCVGVYILPCGNLVSKLHREAVHFVSRGGRNNIIHRRMKIRDKGFSIGAQTIHAFAQ